MQGFGVKTEGKRPLGSPRGRWEDDIIMDFKERGWESVDCIHVAWDRDRCCAVVSSVMNFHVLQNAGYFWNT